MCQMIREKTGMRLRMALLLMATVVMPFCLAGCHAEKIEESESQTEVGEVMAFGRELKLAVVCEPVGEKDRSWVELLVYEFNKAYPDVSVTLMPFGEASDGRDIAMA